MGGAFMIHASDIRQQIIELRQLEEAARVQFDAAKNNLLKIKRRIRELEKLLTPPDMQLLATETVLKQAELIAEELMN
jgi:type I restriction enzyme R subunit